jgi:hypothetical protein
VVLLSGEAGIGKSRLNAALDSLVELPQGLAVSCLSPKMNACHSAKIVIVGI